MAARIDWRVGAVNMNDALYAGALATTLGVMLIVPCYAYVNLALAQKLAVGLWRSLVMDGTNVHDYPLTRFGRQRFEGFRLDLDPSLRCAPPGMPGLSTISAQWTFALMVTA